MLDWGADQVHQLTHDHDPYQKQQQQLQGFRKGPWTPAEDKLLTEYVTSNGEGKWSSVAKCAGKPFYLIMYTYIFASICTYVYVLHIYFFFLLNYSIIFIVALS